MYSLPSVAVQVLDLTNQPTVDTQALKECLENDPALVVKVLRVANSSLFGLSGKVTSLSHALALLGIKPLKMLVLGFSLPKELFEGVDVKILTQYWKGTLIKSVAARELSQQFWKQSGDEPFIAALLQDIGMLVLIQQLGESYTTFLAEARQEGIDIPKLELDTLGFDHAVLSARMLEAWSLPEILIRAVGSSRDSANWSELPEDELALCQILHLADSISQLLTATRTNMLPVIFELGQQYREVSPTQMEEFVLQLASTVAELAEVWSIDLSDDLDFVEILASAHAQMAELTEGMAADPAGGAWPDRERKGWSPAQRTLADEAELSLLHAGSSSNSARAAVANMAATLVRESCDSMPESTSELGFIGQVDAAVQICRQNRCPLSLMLIELDRYEDMIVDRGIDGAEQRVHMLASALDFVCDAPDSILHLGGSRFALILEDHDRAHVVDLARQVSQDLNEDAQVPNSRRSQPLTVSAGIASLSVPPRNFPGHELIESAERCLYASKAGGGGGGAGVKSIELY